MKNFIFRNGKKLENFQFVHFVMADGLDFDSAFKIVKKARFKKIDLSIKSFENKVYTYALPYIENLNDYVNCFNGRKIEIGHLKDCERGKVSYVFSRASRIRLLRKIDSFNVNYQFFITLTYPVVRSDMDACYRDLFHFTEKIDDFFGRKCLYVWKKEFQSRGALHYHVLLYVPGFSLQGFSLTSFYTRVLMFWNQSANIVSMSSTNTELVRSVKGVIWYASLYTSKKGEQTKAPDFLIESGLPVGRWWGVINSRFFSVKKVQKLQCSSSVSSLVEDWIHEQDSPDYDYKKALYHSNLMFKPEGFDKFFQNIQKKDLTT